MGGSLAERPRSLAPLMRTLARLAGPRTLLVVPGGGRFADEVRRADRRFRLDASAAHWMAILAMDQSAYLLAHLSGDAALVQQPGEIEAGRLNVLAPSAWLRRVDPLPHSWSVTSDSIAAWVARALGAGRLALLKDVDGLLDGDPARSARPRLRRRAVAAEVRGVVDGYFGRALGPAMPCWILNGARPARIARWLSGGRAEGTEIVSRPAGRVRPPSARRGAAGPGRGRARR